VTSRTYFTTGVVIAALLFGGWKLLVPTADSTSDGAAAGVSQMLATTTRAAFTGAAASLDVQRSTAGTYAGAQLQPGMTLVRADATGYCVQTTAGTDVQHLVGPGGTPAAGPC